uniref:C2H2-type domain-containing protein n=1 Tax=Ditylenchus dipsaci TaxID=166011 RepID=A0A915D8C7_9BILA
MQMDKSPLAMLAKACETIGCNSDSSPNKSKTHSKNGSNGSSKSTNNSRHSLQNSPHGNHAYFDSVNGNGLNGKHTKKENGQQHTRKGSPRANFTNVNGALNCEPSTSSPSNAQLQQGHPLNMANNGAFPGLLQRCFPGGMPPNGYPVGANPFNIMAAMAAFGGQQGIPPPGMMPSAPTSRVPNTGANPNSITTTTTALSAPIPAPSQPLLNPLSKTPPATNHQQNQAKRSALATPTSSAASGQMSQFSSQAEMEFANLVAQQQAMAMFGNPFAGAFPPAAFFGPQNGAMMQAMTGMTNAAAMPMPLPAQGYLDNSNAGSSASVQAMLMAAACGQQPRFVCTYAIKNSSCNKSFETESELFGHYRLHISQLTNTTNASSPILVSSTTTDPTVSTASSAPPSTPNLNISNSIQQQNGGGKMKVKQEIKSSPPAASPKQPASLPPMWNFNSPSGLQMTPPTTAANSRLQLSNQQQFQQHQAMAAAMNNAQQHQNHQNMAAMQQAMAIQYDMAMAAAAGMPPPFAINMMNPAQQMAFANGFIMNQGGQQQQQQVVEKTV